MVIPSVHHPGLLVASGAASATGRHRAGRHAAAFHGASHSARRSCHPRHRPPGRGAAQSAHHWFLKSGLCRCMCMRFSLTALKVLHNSQQSFVQCETLSQVLRDRHAALLAAWVPSAASVAAAAAGFTASAEALPKPGQAQCCLDVAPLHVPRTSCHMCLLPSPYFWCTSLPAARVLVLSCD